LYGLPEDFDARIFVGSTVEQICVTANQIVVQFEVRFILTIEGPYCLLVRSSATAESQPVTQRLQVPTFVPEILSLIEQKVISATSTRDGTLTLQFEKGDLLQVLDDSPAYESYRIFHRGVEVIV
jgi:hypothetical protein